MPRDPYTVLLSEVMAQQTQIDRVVPAYERLLACFPTVEALAAASEDAVVAAFSGLGYYRRARLLHQTAQAVVAAGGWPAGEAELRKLPGIGSYTAAALSAFAFSGKTPPVDGNVMRIAARSLALALPLGSPALARAAAAWLAALHAEEPTPFIFEAAMELGASVCTPATPSCPVCPLRSSCRAAGEGRPERYPAPRPVRATESQTWVVLWARRDTGEVLLLRVDEGPLLAGLWLPPFRPRDGKERAAAVAAELAAAHGIPGVSRRVPHAVRHGITHRAITVEVFVLDAPPQAAESVDDTAWRNPEAPELPTSSLLGKIARAVSLEAS
jgi:A/G-specific adenine glycosylase